VTVPVRTGKATKLLPPSTEAPDFTLRVTPDQSLTLSDLFARPIIPAYYRADCSPGLRRSDDALERGASGVQKSGAEIIGLSVDGVWCHEAFAQHPSSIFPRLADLRSKGEVGQIYGTASPNEPSPSSIARASSSGATFAVNPAADGILRA
jgi:peroxiredoxin